MRSGAKSTPTRELRDRWLERVNLDPSILLAQGKYEVSRVLSDARTTTTTIARAVPALPALPAPVAA